MASSSFLTLPKPFLCPPKATFSSSDRRLVGLRKNSLRVNAIVKKWEPSKVVPQADRVLIRLDELEQKTTGGVLLPKSAVKFERYLMGEIISAGAEVQEVEAGKKVLFSDINAYEYDDRKKNLIKAIRHDFTVEALWVWGPLEVDLGTDAKHCFCKASDLLAVVE